MPSVQNELRQILPQIIDKQTLVLASFSDPKKKAEGVSKATVRPIAGKKKRLYQISEQKGCQVFHRNVENEELLDVVLSGLCSLFDQAVLFTTEMDYYLVTNRKGQTTVSQRPASKQLTELTHNRTKMHLLHEGDPSPFLTALGITNTQGRVYPQMMAKFRQINRFLELVADTLPAIHSPRKMHVVDFGCGKAYLTFALYDLLHRIHGLDIDMTGLDLKQEVIANCQRIAETLKLPSLHFIRGDIAHYQPKEMIDMVVALHACNTATDQALARAVRWNARIILAAPCCQHELYKQVSATSLDTVLQHGILRERFAALVTDAARADLLEMHGYRTQVVELIDSAHTPKNLLIRAVYGNTARQRAQAAQRYKDLKATLAITPCLEGLLAP